MRKTLTLLPLMAVAIACGPMSEEEVDSEIVVEDREIFTENSRGTETNDSQPGDEEGPGDDAWDEEEVGWGGWESGGMSDLSAVMSGQVGEHFITGSLGEEARAFGDYFGDDESWQTLMLDTRVDVAGENAMMMIMLDGDLMNGALEQGIKLEGEDELLFAEDGEVFAMVRACTGEEDAWDYDVPAEEAEIEMTPDQDDPQQVTLTVSATFMNPDTGLSEPAKAVFSMRLDD